jgi:hypothetical protein
VGGFTISGRLSELCGLGLVNMNYTKVQLVDERTMEYRFMKKPVWNLTEEGLEVAQSNVTNLQPETEEICIKVPNR